MLVETDSPYLAPVPHRGKSNQPAFVKHVAEEIARLRGVAFDEVGARHHGELLPPLSPRAGRVRPSRLLLQCRAGFEKECAQEITARGRDGRRGLREGAARQRLRRLPPAPGRHGRRSSASTSSSGGSSFRGRCARVGELLADLPRTTA
jgi:hypothetical protein